jgi:hypothetical protein
MKALLTALFSGSKKCQKAGSTQISINLSFRSLIFPLMKKEVKKSGSSKKELQN